MPRALDIAFEAFDSLRRSRAAKRQPSGFDFVLADRLDFLSSADWDAITARASIFMQRDYLRAFESHPPANVLVRYVIAHHSGVPRMAMVVQRAAVDWRRFPKKQAVESLVKVELPEEQMLVCGNLLAPVPGVAFAPGVDPVEVDWLAVGEALYRLRRADKLLGQSSVVMCKDVPADAAGARDALRLLGYRSLDTEPNMVLALDAGWKRREDYLASMTSGYRGNVNRLHKQLAAGGATLRMLSVDEVQANAEAIARLYQHVHDKHALRLATPSAGFVPALARALGERFRCRGAWLGDQLVGFVTSLVGPDGDAHGYFIGYEPEANEAMPIYLSLLQSTVDDAIEFGAKRLSLGRTALTPKANLGCKPQPTMCLVRHRVPTMNPLLGAAFRFVEPEQPPQRSPFKVGKDAPNTAATKPQSQPREDVEEQREAD